ncbi:hypothetical protein [Oleisolibacter albus]|uniref:hypothetical protein n=1 Tax=Oleisolibacter albus TaxID=2171757 RepID=UPI0012D7D37F|nr:hypothetical protein [Oleisolibacter albus]
MSHAQQQAAPVLERVVHVLELNGFSRDEAIQRIALVRRLGGHPEEILGLEEDAQAAKAS